MRLLLAPMQTSAHQEKRRIGQAATPPDVGNAAVAVSRFLELGARKLPFNVVVQRAPKASAAMSG